MEIDIRKDQRFRGIEPFAQKRWLSSPTMHGEELDYIREAFDTNWMSTVGENIDSVEKKLTEMTGIPYAVALGTGTSALHLAIRMAGVMLYGQPAMAGVGAFAGKKVFCTDMTFGATVNPVAYEDGEAVFIETERETWNMSPEALERGFSLYPDVKLVVMAHLYGTPGRIRELREICDRHGALLVEDAAESLGATVGGRMTGSFGDFGVISFNGNKIVTGSCGGALLVKSREIADRIRKWSTQSREQAPWYQHAELGYNYRMSNVVAGVIRGQLLHLSEHIAQKKAIYERYRKGFEGLPVTMNPTGPEENVPNYWLSCLMVDRRALCPVTRTATETTWTSMPGKSCPDEINAALHAFNAESRPIWKPMHLQPLYHEHLLVTEMEDVKIYARRQEDPSVGADIFARGLCLPSDNKLTPEDQDRIIEIVRRCFSA